MTKFSFLTGTAIAALLATPALAQDTAPVAAETAQTDPAQADPAQTDPAPAGEDAFGDIVVTARNRNETLQSVPIAITALSEQRIEREGVQNIAGVAKLSPSLVFDKYFSPQDNRPTIRGLPATRGRPPVAILIDGFDTTTESIATAGGGNLMDIRMADFERIEVVKGPQSALYGRSAFGGAINYITKEPGDTLGGYVAGEVGTYGRYEIRGAIDLPISDTLSYRVNGVYTNYDGYYRNSTTGNKLGGYEAWGGAIAVKWEPSSDFKLVGRASISDDRSDQQATKYYGSANGLATTLRLPANVVGQRIGTGIAPASIQAYRFGYIDNENVPIALSPDPADPTGQSDYPGVRTRNVIATLRAEYDLGFAQLLSKTGYVTSQGDTVADVDYFGRAYTPVSLPAPGGLGEYSGSAANNGFWQFDIDNTTKQFSQELRLGNLSDGRFRWAIGGLYWQEKVDQIDRRFSSFGLGAGASVSLNTALQGGRATVGARVGRDTRHWSGYGIAEFDIVPTVTIAAEGRYATEKLDYAFGPTVGLRSTSPAAGPVGYNLIGTYSSASSTTDYFTPRGIVSWKPNSDMLFYASAARGVKPGGFTQVGAADPNLGRYESERLSNYEVGAKVTLFDGMVRINAAAFHIDYSDKQTATLVDVPTTVSATGVLSVTTNAGSADVDGQEIELTLRPTRELTLTAGYTHLVPKYTDYVYNSTTALTIARAGSCTIITVGTQQTCQITQTGNDLEMAPRHSLTGMVNYTTEVADGVRVFGEAQALARSKRTVFEDGHWLFRPYAVVDVKLGLETDKWSLTAYVDNVLDDRTIKSAINLLDVAAGSGSWLNMIAYMPDPRTAGLRMRYNF